MEIVEASEDVLVSESVRERRGLDGGTGDSGGDSAVGLADRFPILS